MSDKVNKIKQDETKDFKNRVYGCIIVKAINANYNADFSGLPRRLKSDGTFYATDKSFKWSVRNYIKKHYEDEKVLFTKQRDDKQNTMKLKESFEKITNMKVIDDTKNLITSKLIENFIDVRLFGAVFSPEGTKDNNVSIHGPVQINHAIDLYQKGRVYTDEILAPFTAIGSMSKATEVHYAHNFSLNPQNLFNYKEIEKNKNKLEKLEETLKNNEKTLKEDEETLKKDKEALKTDKKNKKLKDNIKKLDEKIKESKKELKQLNEWITNLKNETKYMQNLQLLSKNDLTILKNSFNSCVTYYDSHSKAGCENELSIYVTLNDDSKLVLLGFAQFIKFYKANEKYKGKVYDKNSFDLTNLIKYLEKYNTDIKSIEIYYNNILTDILKDEKKLENKDKDDENKIKLYDLEELNKQENKNSTEANKGN